MRKVSILAVLLYVTSASFAQTSDAEADAMINLLGVQKREAVSKLVYVATKDSATFWKIYDEYMVANKATAKIRMRLYESTAQAYGNMNAKTADSLATAYFSNRNDQEKSLQTYYNKLKASVNAVTAFEFYQAEVYLLTQIRASIMQQVPTYGEIHRAVKAKQGN